MKWLKSQQQEQPTLSLKEQQAEKLAELGARLCASRQERASSLEQMAVVTKIPRRLLEAIEQGKLDDLPEPVYIQGLIRQFADALGFNGVEFASSFPIGQKSVKFKPTTNKHSTSVIPPWRIYYLGLLRPAHLYLLYVFVIVCSVSSLSNVLNNNAFINRNSQPEPNTLNFPTLANLTPVRDTLKYANNQESVHIGVTLKASSWIRVVADGKVEFEGVLPKGSQSNWKAQEELTVQTDNGGSVLMSINQQAAQQMGNPGRQKEIRIGSRPTN
jgi:cytoskeletal protein RodZ